MRQFEVSPISQLLRCVGYLTKCTNKKFGIRGWKRTLSKPHPSPLKREVPQTVLLSKCFTLKYFDSQTILFFPIYFNLNIKYFEHQNIFIYYYLIIKLKIVFIIIYFYYITFWLSNYFYVAIFYDKIK